MEDLLRELRRRGQRAPPSRRALYVRRRTEAAGKDAELAPRLIVTLAKSFHGRTLATLAATAQPAKQEAFQPLPAGFTATPINDVEALSVCSRLRATASAPS